MADTRIVGKRKMTARTPGKVHLSRKKKKDKVKAAKADAKKTKPALAAQPPKAASS